MRIRKTRGFSLIEILVAIAIFGVMLGGVFTSLNRGNDLLHTSADLLQARLLANATIEAMKARPFKNIQSHSFAEMTPQGRMTVEVQVSDFQSSTLKKIDVSVHWQNHYKQSRKLALSALRSQYVL